MRDRDAKLIWEASRTNFRSKKPRVDVIVPSPYPEINQLKDWMQEFLSQTSSSPFERQSAHTIVKEWSAIKELAKEKIKDINDKGGLMRGRSKVLQELSELIARIDDVVRLNKVTVKQADLMDHQADLMGQAKAAMAKSEIEKAEMEKEMAEMKKEMGSFPKPKPRGITIHKPSYDEIKSEKDYMFVADKLYRFIAENNITSVEIGNYDEGITSRLTRGTLFDRSPTKNWLEISDKLLLERIFTKDIKNLSPQMYETQKKILKDAPPELKEKTGWMHYLSLYNADFPDLSDRPYRPQGLTKEQLKEIIQNAPNEMLSTSQFDKKDNINKLTKVAIIKKGVMPHSSFKLMGNKNRERSGAFKIELLYADTNSPLHDLYESSLPLELKRNIDESLRELGYEEGEKSETTSLSPSRSKSLIEKAKEENIQKYGALTCMKCGVQPAKDYYFKNQKVSPSLANRIIEGHHIHGVRETDKATTKDIELLCRNCHIYETRISK